MKSVVSQRFVNCFNKLKEDKVVRSARQFALSLDYLPQSLSEILKGRRDVTVELLRKAIESYKINPVYIYTGEGSMFMTEENHQSFRVLTVVANSQNDERIVHVPVPAQAGYVGDVTDPTFIQNLPHFTLPDYKYKVGTHRSFDVHGDSMEPTLFEGDKVVCSYIEPLLWESAMKDNYVYVIVTRGDILIKRIFNRLKEKKHLVMVSDNNFYEPYPVEKSDIREVWYVRAKISPFLPSPTNIQNMLQTEMRELQDLVNNQTKLINRLNLTIEKLFDNQNK